MLKHIIEKKKVTNKRASPLPCTKFEYIIFQLEVLIYSSALCFIIFIFIFYTK